MSWKSPPLAVQLTLVLVGLVLATTLVLTVFAYRSIFTSLEADARRAVRAAAHTRAQLVTQVLSAHHERARALLVTAESACSERSPRGRLSWAPDCLSPMVRDFRAAERAGALHLTYRGRRIASSGSSAAPHVVTPPDALAAVLMGSDGRPDYQTRTKHGDMILLMRFDGGEIQRLLSDPSGLRSNGEVFLMDAAGRFLTPARYWSSETTLTPPGVVSIEPLTECLSGPGEIVGNDYRGVRTIHGFEPLAALGGACVDAHMDYEDAMAPAQLLRAQLVVQGALFALLGAMFSLIAAHWIAAPVRRLADVAREVQAGHFRAKVPLAGPSEVQGLGRAFQGMAADLAELVAREQAARREAEGANKTKDEFLATVSHELRTPLSAILGWTRLLRMGSLNVERSAHALQAIERSADVLRRLVEDLLDVSRVMANRVRIVSAPTDLASVVEKALDAVRPQAADKSIRLEASIEGEGLVVLGDAERLQQVVWNLVWNAVKFTPNDGWVRVTVRREGPSVELAVSDNGAGIPGRFIPFVFDWFRQGDAVARGSQSGLGLGLGLVQHLVRLHGGSVRVESAGEGHGSTFVVTLPAHTESLEEIAKAHATVEAPLESVGVLVVDDDVDTLDVLRALLEHAGAHVRTAISAAAARREISVAEPDVLISDISMPQEDGYVFMRALRAANVMTPAIALTALTRREDAETARAAGYHLHLIKPADPDDLIAAVSTLNEHRSGHGQSAPS